MTFLLMIRGRKMEKINVNVTIKPWNLMLVGALTAIFVVLKVLGYINWSWLWVLSPIWIDFGLMIVLFFVMIIGYKIINLGNK